MGRCVLVTGGAGAIGTNLVKRLLDLGDEVIVLDDLSSGHAQFLPDGAVLIEGSITDDAALENAFSYNPTIIYHLAALFANQNSVDHPEKDLAVNGKGTLKLLIRSREANVQRFVYTSSSCVYGNLDAASAEETSTFHLDTPYAITKLLGEQYVSYFSTLHLPTVILRVFNSFGPGELPGEYRNVIPNFFSRAMDGKPLVILGTGEETRDFNWVGNLIDALVTVAEHKDAVGEIFNIGSGKETTILELARSINAMTGNAAGIEYGKPRSWDTVKRRCANIEKARRTLGYEPDIDLEKHLEETYQWLKSLR